MQHLLMEEVLKSRRDQRLLSLDQTAQRSCVVDIQVLVSCAYTIIQHYCVFLDLCSHYSHQKEIAFTYSKVC